MWAQQLVGKHNLCLKKYFIHHSVFTSFIFKVCITELTAGGNQVLIDGRPNFWLDNDNYNCLNGHMSSDSIKFKNGQFSQGFCNSDLNQWFHLPDDYIFSEKFWGAFYYKTHGLMTFENAREKCANDGASLPVPRSSYENDFYAALYPEGQVWLGLTTSKTGTTVETKQLNGEPALYTSWGENLKHAENSATEAYTYIDTRNLSGGLHSDLNHWNNNKASNDVANAICVYKISRE